ncbi:hypothetical protein LWI29_020608 [Acer saccharum]|uniref:Gnk2-homologous domain-containing protein n=1 Tax=Acer saccharum TaxID=4024 RepID=A0AA39SBM4_ACESA|nr:hypothetical protein LWI29_020608 [Acer saccharum]
MSSSSSNNNAFYFLVSFALLLQSAFGVTEPLFHSCSGENFTVYGPYEKNLNRLMGFLYHQTPYTGFGLGSTSFGAHYPDQPYGIALCRGDVSSSDCKTCVAEASSYIRKSCPNRKQATIWYDNCSLKYSDEKFFGQIDHGTKFYSWNTQNVTNPTYFNQKAKDLLTHLAHEASVTPKMYAAGELKLEGSEKEIVYGMAQCTRDLSDGDCKTCLDGLIGDLPSCCDGKQGGRVVTGSYWRFFSTVDSSPKLMLSNVNNVTDPVVFNRQLGNLLRNLSSNASSSTSKFSVGQTNFSDFQNINALVQCTRDLAGDSCSNCLQDIIRYIPQCCNGKQGGRVLSLSCNLRFEIYPFFLLSSPPPPSLVQPNSTSQGGNS